MAQRRRPGCLLWGCGLTLLLLVVGGGFAWRWYSRDVKPWLAEKREAIDQVRGLVALVADGGVTDQLEGGGAPRGQSEARQFPLPELVPSFAEAPAFDTVSPTDASAFFRASATAEELVAELRELGERAGFVVGEPRRDEKAPTRTLELARPGLLVRADVLATGLAPGVDVFLRVQPAPVADGGAP